MKVAFKSILVTALTTLSTFTAIVYFSCNRDKCKAIVCAHNGVCNDGRCTCLTGYEGPNCETVAREKFLGNWSVYEKGSTTNAAQYPITIEPTGPSTEAPVNVVIRNFYNYFLTPIKATVTGGDSLIIPNQQYEGKIVHGIGYMDYSVTYGQYGTIFMRYEIIDTATNVKNDFGFYEPIDHSKPSRWNK
jgi:hypothetical protein